jgi:hypothetical protein
MENLAESQWVRVMPLLLSVLLLVVLFGCSYPTAKIPYGYGSWAEYDNYVAQAEAAQQADASRAKLSGSAGQALAYSAEQRKCAEIGFQPGTPDFGNCVLQLMQMQASAASAAQARADEEKRRNREQGIRMMQVGFGMAAGGTASSSSSRPITTPGNTVLIRRPNGQMVTCSSSTGNVIFCN